MTEPTINIKGLEKLGFKQLDENCWDRELVNGFYLFIVIRDGEPCEGGIEDGESLTLRFDSITYKQAKAIIEVFGTRF